LHVIRLRVVKIQQTDFILFSSKYRVGGGYKGLGVKIKIHNLSGFNTKKA
jgi:hypothetical protein